MILAMWRALANSKDLTKIQQSTGILEYRLIILMKILSPRFISNAQFQRGSKSILTQSRELTPSHYSRTIEVKRSQTSDGIRVLNKQYHQSVPLRDMKPHISFQFAQIEKPFQSIIFNKFSHSFYSKQLKTIDLCNKSEDQPIHSRRSTKFNNILFAKKRAKSKSQSVRLQTKNVPIKSMIVARSCKIVPQQIYSEQIMKQIVKKPKITFRNLSHRPSQRKNVQPWSPKKGELHCDEMAYY